MSRLFRYTHALAVAAALFSGVAALTYKPAPLSAQITCWVCVCDGANCKCAQVACPKPTQEELSQ